MMQASNTNIRVHNEWEYPVLHQVETPPDPRPSKYCSTEPALQSNTQSSTNGEKMGSKAFVDHAIRNNKVVVLCVTQL